MKRFSFLWTIPALFLFVITGCRNIIEDTEDYILLENYSITVPAEGNVEHPLENPSKGMFYWRNFQIDEDWKIYACDFPGLFILQANEKDGYDCVGIDVGWLKAEYLTSDRRGMKITVYPNQTASSRKCTIGIGMGRCYPDVTIIQAPAPATSN